MIKIKDYSIDFTNGKEMEKWVISECEKLLYLMMAANPPSTARVYFNVVMTGIFIHIKRTNFDKVK